MYLQTLQSLGKHYKFDIDEKFSNLSKEIKEKLLYGSGDEKIEIIYNDGTRVFRAKKVDTIGPSHIGNLLELWVM